MLLKLIFDDDGGVVVAAIRGEDTLQEFLGIHSPFSDGSGAVHLPRPTNLAISIEVVERSEDVF